MTRDPAVPVGQLRLVHALTAMAHAHDEAAHQTTKPKVIAILLATATDADAAARAVQHDQLLTDSQAALAVQAEKDL